MVPPPALPDRLRRPDKNRPSYSASSDRAGAVKYESSAPRLKARSRQIDGTLAAVPGVLTWFPWSGQFKAIAFVITFNLPLEQSYFAAGKLPSAHLCLCCPSKFEKHPLQP